MYILVEELNSTMKLPVLYTETFNKAFNGPEIDVLWNLMVMCITFLLYI